MRKFLLPLALLLALWATTTQLFAAFSLSATPSVTRNHINFGQVKEGDVVTQEVELKVTNDTSVRYRITQVMLDTLKNERGEIFPAEQIKLFLRSASRGTMLVQAPAPLQVGTMELYTSDESGTQDTMTLAYTLFVPQQFKGGTYQGRMTFNLEPLTANSNASLQSVTLDFSFDLEVVFQMVISSESGKGKIDFGKISPGDTEKSTEMSFETTSNLGQEYRIYQSLSNPLVNAETGEFLPIENMVDLRNEPVLIYQSSGTGDSDRFLGNYRLKNISTLTAGRYTGEILLTVETSAVLPAGVQTRYSIPVTLEIEPIFDFVITPENGDALQFKNLKAGDVVEGKLTVEVRTNAHQSYQLQQMVGASFSSAQGEALPEKNFEMMLKDGKMGQAAFQGFQAVKIGATALYTSNHKGDPDQITIVYRLSVPSSARGGDYRIQLSFALTLL